MTNLNKKKEEIIYELLISLNNGNNATMYERLKYAKVQYSQLVEEGIVKEFPSVRPKKDEDREEKNKLKGLYFGAVLKYYPPNNINIKENTCVFLKDDACGDAVVVFKGDDFVSYVEHKYLSWND